MELMTKQGYMQTEVGLIPEDWEIEKIGSLSEIATGSTPPTRDKSNYGEEYLFIGPGDLGRNKIITNAEKKLSQKGYSLSRKFPKGSILFTCIGSTIGKSGIAGVDLTSNQQINAVFPNTAFDTDFLYYELQLIAKKIKSQAGEQAVPMVNKTEFSEFKIPLPPTLTEQKAIATALSDVDALISSLEQGITKKKAIKQGAMQELLTPPHKGGKRLPGFSGEWVEINLGKSSILKARIGWQGLTTAEYLDTGDYYLITGTDFKGGYIDWDNCVYVEKNRFDQDKNIQIKPKDVLVTKDGTIGKVAYVNQVSKPTTLNSGVFVIRPIQGAYYPRFFYYTLMSEHFDSFLGKLTAGSTISHLYQKDFIHYSFPIPPTIEEQKAIAQILSDMDAEITQLEAKKAKYQAIKQGMMQELLTGKTRLV